MTELDNVRAEGESIRSQIDKLNGRLRKVETKFRSQIETLSGRLREVESKGVALLKQEAEERLLHRWIRISDNRYVRVDKVTAGDSRVFLNGASVEMCHGYDEPDLYVSRSYTVQAGNDEMSRFSVVDDIGDLLESLRRKQDEIIFAHSRKDVSVILGREYRTVTIGGMTWMAENLRADVGGSFAPDSEYEERYGRLYTWYAAVKAAAEAQGWHLPSAAEWDKLAQAVGGSAIAGTKLKATTFSDGTDDYGFSALPAGYSYSGSFNNVGSYGYFWTSTENYSSNAYYRFFSSGASMSSDYGTKTYGSSVRLVKDA